MLRFTMGLVLATAALASVVFAHAQSTDDSLRLYAINILQDPPQPWTGYGVYLGKGLVITAAHVVGSASRTHPSVRIAGLELPAKAIKEGSFDRTRRRRRLNVGPPWVSAQLARPPAGGLPRARPELRR